MGASFKHPGVLVSREQLDYVREKVRSGQQPWKEAYDRMMCSDFSKLTWQANPVDRVICCSRDRYCDGDGVNPVCSQERKDALAAYTHALAWSLTGDAAHAQKAIGIMDAWSAVLIKHDGTNAPLQAAWAGSSFTRAAELIRHTYEGPWPEADRCAAMLRSVFLPVVLHDRPDYAAKYNGNWELMMMEAAAFIAVFLDDRDSYEEAMRVFRRRVPAYLYLELDGATPIRPLDNWPASHDKVMDYWNNPPHLVNGLSQETCRDFGHTGYGIASICHIAETARIQGDDVYPDLRERLRHGLGLHARYANGAAPIEDLTGNPNTDIRLGPVTEIGYNALHYRLGVPMDQTGIYTEQHRPQGHNELFVAWETLTHAENPY